MINLKIKKVHPDAVIPTLAYGSSNGFDLTAISYSMKNNYIEYKTGLSFAIPDGYVGILAPRSSVSNYDLSLANSLGVLDHNFRGEVTFRFRYTKEHNKFIGSHIYENGNKIGQLLIIPNPRVQVEVVTELPDSERGTNGYGSSGL